MQLLTFQNDSEFIVQYIILFHLCSHQIAQVTSNQTNVHGLCTVWLI